MPLLFPGFEEVTDPRDVQRLAAQLNRTQDVGPLKMVADLVPGTHDHYVAVAPAESDCGNFDHTTLEVLGRALEESLATAGRSAACVYHVWSGVLPPEADEAPRDLLLRGTVRQLGELRHPAGHGLWWQEAPTTLIADGLIIATHTDVSELFIGSDLRLLPVLREAALQVREVSPDTVPTFCR